MWQESVRRESLSDFLFLLKLKHVVDIQLKVVGFWRMGGEKASVSANVGFWFNRDVSLTHQSHQPVRPRITTGWTDTRTKHWMQMRWGAGERRRASSSGNRNENSRYETKCDKLPLHQVICLLDEIMSLCSLCSACECLGLLTAFCNPSFSNGGMWTFSMKKRSC